MNTVEWSSIDEELDYNFFSFNVEGRINHNCMILSSQLFTKYLRKIRRISVRPTFD